MAENKIAVVTGASKGIGLAVTEALLAEGYRVVAGARTISPELRLLTPHTLAVDLATPGGPADLVAVASALGGIDLLVNNVGGTSGPHPGGFLAVTDEDWLHTLEATLFSAIRASRAALPSLVERGGQIITIGSVNARRPAPHLVDLAAAKAALLTLGKALAEEFGPRGVRVNTVSPGPVRTAVWTEPGSTGDTLARQRGLSQDELLDTLPAAFGMSTSRIAEPAEIAALVAFLASGKAPNIHGADLVVDGGLRKEI
ncbi:SDR family oxidoreductase [Nocardia blacklockiae]|uniref:SDR family oxidoreductase n=1 Tax=Nocardia blacklockiae TaxID=480036 RepID=UPI0018947CAB|nr:SDR family oxidoreductase [Nocardia blacklockiae]MBF6176478.1 SDR family oxidoreductase [Nocardia blacklockiae]